LKSVRISALTVALASVAMMLPASSSAAGLMTATSSPTGASGTVLDLGSVLTLGQSNTSKTAGPSVTVLRLLNMNLLSKDAHNHNTGALAAVGNLLDAINRGLCKNGTTASGFCLALLSSSDAMTTTASGSAQSASYQTVALTLANLHIRLLGSSASSVFASLGGVPLCQNGGLAYILSTDPIVPGTTGLNIQNESVTTKCA
jgi:hypothetical protein